MNALTAGDLEDLSVDPILKDVRALLCRMVESRSRREASPSVAPLDALVERRVEGHGPPEGRRVGVVGGQGGMHAREKEKEYKADSVGIHGFS